MKEYIKARMNEFGLGIEFDNIDYSISFSQGDHVALDWEPLPGVFSDLVERYQNHCRDELKTELAVIESECRFIKSLLGIFPKVDYFGCDIKANPKSCHLDIWGLFESFEKPEFGSIKHHYSEYMGVEYRLTYAEVNRKKPIWERFIEFVEIYIKESCAFIYQKLSSAILNSYVDSNDKEIYRRSVNDEYIYVIEKVVDETGEDLLYLLLDEDVDILKTLVESAASGESVLLMLKAYVLGPDGVVLTEILQSNYLNVNDDLKNKATYLQLEQDVFSQLKSQLAA